MTRRNAVILVLLALALLAPALASLFTPRASAAPASPSPVERGGYLVRAMGCNDCHTPWQMGPNGPAPDMTRMLSGHPEALVITEPPPAPALPWMATMAATNTAWAGPWGVSFTMNLTPDKETGLGSWTPEMFRAALRSGRHMGRGRPILPPMPWFAIRELTDADLDAVFAYLQSIPAVKNRIPEPLPHVAAPAATPASGSQG